MNRNWGVGGVVFFVGLSLLSIQTLSKGRVLLSGGRTSLSRVSQEVHTDGIELRAARKVGLGWGAAGALGFLGINLELNFSPDVSVVTGFGVSSGFQAFSLKIKKTVAGRRFLPYLAGGFARWYSVGENKNFLQSSPSVLSKRFLSDKEKSSGNFSENFLYPSLGLQYIQIDGEWKGTSLYSEVLLLIDLDDFVVGPLAEVGMVYYF